MTVGGGGGEGEARYPLLSDQLLRGAKLNAIAVVQNNDFVGMLTTSVVECYSLSGGACVCAYTDKDW